MIIRKETTMVDDHLFEINRIGCHKESKTDLMEYSNNMIVKLVAVVEDMSDNSQFEETLDKIREGIIEITTKAARKILKLCVSIGAHRVARIIGNTVKEIKESPSNKDR